MAGGRERTKMDRKVLKRGSKEGVEKGKRWGDKEIGGSLDGVLSSVQESFLSFHFCAPLNVIIYWISALLSWLVNF